MGLGSIYSSWHSIVFIMVIKEGSTYSIKQLRAAYNVRPPVFKNWLTSIAAELNLQPRQRILTPLQVAAIIKAFGLPE